VAVASADTRFLIAYEGPAVDDGRMPVRDLAPSLLALSDLVQEANAVAPMGAPSVTLDIQAFRPGSFEVWLALNSVAGVFSADPVTAAVNLIALTTTGLDLLRSLGARSVVRRLQAPDNQTVLRLGDGVEVVAQRDAAVLVERETFRGNARALFAPLRRPRMDRLRIVIAPNVPEFVVTPADLPAFDEPPAARRELINETDVRLALRVDLLSFVEGNKWRLNDGERTEWYDVLDEAFLSRVQDGRESFRSGDTLISRVRLEQWRDADGELRQNRTIMQVMEHRPPPEHPHLL
jgi:hypothetical protein